MWGVGCAWARTLGGGAGVLAGIKVRQPVSGLVWVGRGATAESLSDSAPPGPFVPNTVSSEETGSLPPHG